MNKKIEQVPNDYFWKLIDEYENGTKTFQKACDIIIKAHKDMED